MKWKIFAPALALSKIALVAMGGVTLAPATAAAQCIDMPVSCRISSQFGPRLHPVKKTWRNHNGTDFACPVGTPVLASVDGVVTYSGFQNGGGNIVKIRRDTLELKYMHNHRNIVQYGERVEMGLEVAKSGNTGTWTTGPHLHFEAWIGNKPVDPMSLSCSGGGSVPPVAEGDLSMPAFDEPVRDGLDGSFWDMLGSAISSRAVNPDYVRQLSTLDKVRLLEELNYMEGIEMRISNEKLLARQRMAHNRAMMTLMRNERVAAPELMRQHDSATQSISNNQLHDLEASDAQ